MHRRYAGSYDRSYVWSSLGIILLLNGAMLCIPMAVGRYCGESEAMAFLISAMVTVLLGGSLLYRFRPKRKKNHMRVQELYAIITYGWIAVILFSMLPYLLTGAVHSVTDAFFESVSGFTMTGATVLEMPEAQAQCVLLWRSMTQWLGGLGVLVLFVALQNGQGVALHARMEGSGVSKQKVYSKTWGIAAGIVLIYLLYTALLTLFYLLCGIGLFDAVNHGLTVISTGGFSTKTAGIGAFDNAAMEWITIVAMLLTGGSYLLIFRIWQEKRLRGFAESTELRVYLLLILVASIATICFIAPEYEGNLALAIRHGVFQVVSMITTSGFVLCDVNQWVLPAQLLMMLLMLSGACKESVSGGIKINRHIILFQKAVQEIRRFLHPNLVTRLKSNGQLIAEDVVVGVHLYFYSYIVVVVLGTAVLSMCGIELQGAITMVVSCFGGVGPAFGFGESALFYGALPHACKWLLGGLMLLGRLEIYAVLVLIRPFHRKARERERMLSLEILEKDGVIEPLVRDYDDV